MAFIRYKQPYQSKHSDRPRIAEPIPRAEALKIKWLIEHPSKQKTKKVRNYCDNVLQLALGDSSGYTDPEAQRSLLPDASVYDKRYV